MYRVTVCMISIFLVFAATISASQISRIILSELQDRADMIVMAKVVGLLEVGDQDHVTIQVESYLKGGSPKRVYTFILVSRGGLKDFDPTLKKDDTGVFFLKSGEREGQLEKAYWGSVAIFQKNHFGLTEGKSETNAAQAIDPAASLDAWRALRVRLGQVRIVNEYERGFRNGLAGPPGLVDGSADYNLGHSDGMLARMGKSPEEQAPGGNK